MGVGVGIRDPENHAAASKCPLVCGNNIEPFVFLSQILGPSKSCKHCQHLESDLDLIFSRTCFPPSVMDSSKHSPDRCLGSPYGSSQCGIFLLLLMGAAAKAHSMLFVNNLAQNGNEAPGEAWWSQMCQGQGWRKGIEHKMNFRIQCGERQWYILVGGFKHEFYLSAYARQPARGPTMLAHLVAMLAYVGLSCGNSKKTL